ncbi:MAG: primosomal protein N' [Cellulomonas sp.]
MTDEAGGEQLTLAGMPVGRRRRRLSPTASVVAADRPVAQVYIDLPPLHLDHAFEYLVPASADVAAQPGTRVKVRFGAQDVDGVVVARTREAEYAGRLVPLRRVVSPVPVLTPVVLRLARMLADRYAGSLVDVLRIAIPPRHARVEAESAARLDVSSSVSPDGAVPTDTEPDGVAGAVARDISTATTGVTLSSAAWTDYRGGAAFLQHLVAGRSPHAVWTALPGAGTDRWAYAIAQAVAATAVSGRGALVVLPSARDVDEMARALVEVGIGPWEPSEASVTRHVRLVADDGPAPRYRAFLAALRGDARVVIGTRSAAFAPVRDLGLAVCWDDRDELHQEPRAPYLHAREVVVGRGDVDGCAVLLGSVTRSTAAQQLVERGWGHAVEADRGTVRRRTPRVTALTSIELAREGPAAAARLPGEVWRVLRSGLERGPVLVQVPRAGYVPVVACSRCRAVARCVTCHGPLGVRHHRGGTPECTWCGRLASSWRCSVCGSGALRAVTVGSERTAEELGRAFPGVPVRLSGAGAPSGVLAEVPDRPALVVATIGAEPRCPGGYSAAALLDAATSTSRPSLQVGEQALHRWLSAASLVRPAHAGGVVVLVGDAAPGPTQALVRWDPAGFAARELAERRELRLPPAVRVAAITGTRDAVEAVVARLDLPGGAEILGPVAVDGPTTLELSPLEQEVRTVVRAPLADADALSRAVKVSMATRSARRESGTVRVQVDPTELM